MRRPFGRSTEKERICARAFDLTSIFIAVLSVLILLIVCFFSFVLWLHSALHREYYLIAAVVAAMSHTNHTQYSFDTYTKMCNSQENCQSRSGRPFVFCCFFWGVSGVEHTERTEGALVSACYI